MTDNTETWRILAFWLKVGIGFLLVASTPARADAIDTNFVMDIEGSLTKEIPDSRLEVGVRVKNISNVDYRYVVVQCTGFKNGNATVQDTGLVERVKHFSTAYGEVVLWHDKTSPPTDVKCRVLSTIEESP